MACIPNLSNSRRPHPFTSEVNSVIRELVILMTVITSLVTVSVIGRDDMDPGSPSLTYSRLGMQDVGLTLILTVLGIR